MWNDETHFAIVGGDSCVLVFVDSGDGAGKVGFTQGTNRAERTTMNHQIKISRVRAGIASSKFPRTAEAIINQIPEMCWRRLSSQDLILVANAIDKSHKLGRRTESQDILSEGAIYSPELGRMIELGGRP